MNECSYLAHTILKEVIFNQITLLFDIQIDLQNKSVCTLKLQML